MMRPRRAKSARPTEAEFFEAVGRAVVGWQQVELSACVLFAVLLRAGNEGGARAAFDRVGNFAMRIELLDVAAKFFFATSKGVGDLPKRWEGLRGRLFSASDLRNRLAHSELWEDGAGLKLTPQLFDLSRVDPANLMKSVRSKKAREVDYETAKNAEQLFEVLSYDLAGFRQTAAKLEAGWEGLGGEGLEGGPAAVGSAA
jgi:hypothetical protein